jgi:hypothetical protein
MTIRGSQASTQALSPLLDIDLERYRPPVALYLSLTAVVVNAFATVLSLIAWSVS